MRNLTTELLREKFVISDAGAKDSEKATVALSNRMVLELCNPSGEVIESYVFRGHNMHLVVRMASRILHTFTTAGPIAKRVPEFDWRAAFDAIVSNYEFAYNPQRWVAVYREGKPVFKFGEYHPFLDLIEKCDHENNEDYDYAIPKAEKMLQATGKNLSVNHDSNVALSVSFEGQHARLGIILRGSNRTTTFSFSAEAKDKKIALNMPQCLGAAAAFLEGVQLSFLVGMNIEKIRIGIIPRFSKEEKQTKEGRQRLNRLASEISNLENAFEVRYRPEKPEFHLLVLEAEELGQKILEPPEEPVEDEADGDEAAEKPPET